MNENHRLEKARQVTLVSLFIMSMDLDDDTAGSIGNLLGTGIQTKFKDGAAIMDLSKTYLELMAQKGGKWTINMDAENVPNILAPENDLAFACGHSNIEGVENDLSV